MGLNAHYRRLLSVLVALTMLSVIVAPAMAVGVEPTILGGDIQGVVTDAVTGEPITWDSVEQMGVPISVEVWYDAGGWWEQITDEWGNALGTTAEDGSYLIQGLTPGTYYLRFVDFWGSGYRTEFYNDAFDINDATAVVVTSGGTTTADIGLGLIEWGAAAGIITDATDGSPVSEVYVDGFASSGFGDWEWVWGSSSLSLGDWTGEAPAGEYKVQFYDPYGRYMQQMYGGGTDWDAAPMVTVAPTHTTPGVDASMTRSGHIKGRVTDSGGNPIQGVYAQAFTVDGNEVAEGAHQLPTDADGYYDYGWLPGGTYRIVFWDPDGRYLQEAYNNHAAPGMYAWEAAALLGDNIVVGAGATVTGKDATLEAAGRITGTVSDSSGGVPFAQVVAYDKTTGGWMGETYTDETGAFALGGLATGDYKLSYTYDMGYGPEWYYAPNWYSNQTSQSTAGFVHVTAGGTIAGANAMLVQTVNWGTVQGVVSDAATGVKLDGMDVYLSVSDGAGGWIQTDYTQTDETGAYRFRYVPVGPVLVEVVDPWLLDYGSMYTPKSWTVAVGGPSVYTGNFAMDRATVDEWGSPLESGIVTGYVVKGDAPGTYVPYAPVEFYQYDEWSGEYWYGGMNTADATGEYVGILPVGTYKVKAGPTTDYAPKYYPAADTITAAQDIVVTDGGVLTGKNIVLPRGNKISGTVTDQNGDPVQGAYVSALMYNADWDVWEPVGWEGSTNAYTDAAGAYTLGGLAAGTYKVAFYGWERELGSKWWKSTGAAQSVDQADTVVFAGAGDTRSAINMALSPAVSIRGTVTDEDANRVSGVKVKLWWDDPAGDWALIQSTYAYRDGDFLLGQFSAGTYYLEFVHDTGLYDTNWYKNAATQAAANPATLGHGESLVITQTVQSNDTTYSPVFGASRVETAIKASEAGFPDGASTVIIATGFNWPDALGGAALAGAYKGPILLTDPTYLPWQVMDEVVRLGATDAIILGGTGAVKAPVESALKSELGQAHVRRLAGDDRYQTAILVAQETVDRLGAAYDGTAFVATGENFPDALGASPLAAAASWPIYLTPGDSLNPLTAAAIEDHGVSTAVILGETGAISTGVASAIDAVPGVDSVVRLGGSSRYETAVKVAQYGVDNVYGLGWNQVAIATGQNYPDALAGGVLQGLSGSVMLLTPSASLDPFVQAKLTAKKSVITEVRYLGGINAVTTPVRTAIANLLN